MNQKRFVNWLHEEKEEEDDKEKQAQSARAGRFYSYTELFFGTKKKY